MQDKLSFIYDKLGKDIETIREQIHVHNALCEATCIVKKHNGICKEGEMCPNCTKYYFIEFELPILEHKNEL